MEEEDIVELPDHSFIIRGVTPLEDVEEGLGCLLYTSRCV